MLRIRRPDLLALDNEVVAFLDRARLQRGKVGSRVGFRIALAPDLLAGDDLGDETLLLLFRAPMHQRGADEPWPGADERQRCVKAQQLLMIDDSLEEAQPASTVFRRPIDAGPSARRELPIPSDTPVPVVFATLGDAIERQGRIVRRVFFEPLPELMPERLGLFAIVKIHLFAPLIPRPCS